MTQTEAMLLVSSQRKLSISSYSWDDFLYLLYLPFVSKIINFNYLETLGTTIFISLFSFLGTETAAACRLPLLFGLTMEHSFIHHLGIFLKLKVFR